MENYLPWFKRLYNVSKKKNEVEIENMKLLVVIECMVIY